MLKKRILLISIIVLISITIKSQINPATARRDWFIGHYVGTLKDSVPGVIINCAMNTRYAFGNDSNVYVPMGGLSFVPCIDSSGGNDRFCSNWSFNIVKYAKLKEDSSVVFVCYSYSGCNCSSTGGFCQVGHTMIFRGKKVSDTPLAINEAELGANNIAVFPNPTINYSFSILTLVEVDEFNLIDIIGKSYPIKVIKTTQGYQIELTSNITSGIYFLTVKKDNSFVTKKVVLNQ